MVEKREKDSFITLSDAMKCVKGAAKHDIKLLATMIYQIQFVVRFGVDNECGLINACQFIQINIWIISLSYQYLKSP